MAERESPNLRSKSLKGQKHRRMGETLKIVIAVELEPLTIRTRMKFVHEF